MSSPWGQWLRRRPAVSSSDLRKGTRRRYRTGPPLYIEQLEDRTLLNASLPSVLQAYDDPNTGVAFLNQIGSTAIVNQALSAPTIPFVNQSLAGIAQLGLPSIVGSSLVTINSMLAGLQGAPTDATATWTQVESVLNAPPFSLVYPSPNSLTWPGTPDSNGNLLEVTYTPQTNSIPPLSLNIDQNTPFSYLNNGFFANVSATVQLTTSPVTFGVDQPSCQQNPMFFMLANPSAVAVSLTSTIAANTINADLSIRDLASVTATNDIAQPILSVTGSLGYYSNPSNPLDAGGKLRAATLAVRLVPSSREMSRARRSSVSTLKPSWQCSET